MTDYLSEHHIRLLDEQLTLVKCALNEALHGGSTRAIQKTFGGTIHELKQLEEIFEHASSETSILLKATQWRQVYDLIHATIYGLGHFEFSTNTGFPIEVALNTNLYIASKLWGVYGESKFPC
ncbi:MAG: hypothetical protein ACJAXK_001305 [Yoonia sp.]|jgi:hypothetical protein